MTLEPHEKAALHAILSKMSDQDRVELGLSGQNTATRPQDIEAFVRQRELAEQQLQMRQNEVFKRITKPFWLTGLAVAVLIILASIIQSNSAINWFLIPCVLCIGFAALFRWSYVFAQISKPNPPEWAADLRKEIYGS